MVDTLTLEESISLLHCDLPPLLQSIIEQVEPLTEEIQNLGEDNFIGYECSLKLEHEETTGKLRNTFVFWGVSVRLYWSSGRGNYPHVVFSMGHLPRDTPEDSLFLIMGEGIPGIVSWWHPKSNTAEEMFATILKALRSGKMEPFVIQELIAMLGSACSIVHQSALDELERRKAIAEREASS